MNQKIKVILKNPWVISAVFFVLSTIPIAYFWNVVITFFNLLWDSIIEKTEVPNWVLISLPMAGIALTIAVLRIITIYNKRKDQNQKTAYLEYTEDTFGTTYYRWTYIANSQNTFIPHNIRGCCKKCKCMLINGGYCPMCKTRTVIVNEHSQIALNALIRHKIDLKYGIILV